jgi:hypothetical protein
MQIRALIVINGFPVSKPWFWRAAPWALVQGGMNLASRLFDTIQLGGIHIPTRSDSSRGLADRRDS